MKFVVTHPYGNEVEVKLHYETKDKIKRILIRTSAALTVAGSIVYLNKNQKKTSDS